MECFVTGGTGHIGNVLIKKLVKLGYKVRALCLPNEDLTPIKNLDIEIIYGDVTDRDFIFKTIRQNDLVFHLAGVIEITPGFDEIVKKVNVDGTKNIVDACVEKNAKLVYTSSVHVIEPISNVVLKEPEYLDENKVVGIYAKTKTIATKYVFEATKTCGLNAIVLYPSGVIGPCDYKVSELGQVTLDYINGKMTGFVKGGYNFVDVRDVADGIISASILGKSGQGYNLSGELVSIKQMFSALNEKIGRKSLPPKIATWFIRIFAKISIAYYRHKKQKPIISDYSLYTLNVNSNFSNEKAKKDLNFKNRSYKQSLFDAVDWFAKNKPELIRKHTLQKIR